MDLITCHFSYGQFPFCTLFLVFLPWTLICTSLLSLSAAAKGSRFVDFYNVQSTDT